MLLFAIAGKAKLGFLYGSVTIYVKVQDGGKKVAKTGVKLAYKYAFATVFTSDVLKSDYMPLKSGWVTVNKQTQE